MGVGIADGIVGRAAGPCRWKLNDLTAARLPDRACMQFTLHGHDCRAMRARILALLLLPLFLRQPSQFRRTNADRESILADDWSEAEGRDNPDR